MKICFLTQNLNTADGGGRFSFNLTLSLKSAGHEIFILTNSDILKYPLLNFLKIRNFFKDSDFIHAVDVWPNGFYARLISLGLKKTVVITALGTYSVLPFYSWRRPLAVWTSEKSQMTAISDYTKNKIQEAVPNLNIKVIFPGFDSDFWSSGQAIHDERISRLKPYILSVGALKPRKGYHNSIKAFAIAAKKIGRLNYVIVGQGEGSDYAEKLKKIISENHLESRVFFVSAGIDDERLLGFYKNAELFFLIPVEEGHHFEGFGIVYLEAAASGLPVVASKNSGAESAVRDGYNGILVPQNDPEAAAGAIFKILESQDLKDNLRKNGLEWIKNFNLSKITAQYIQIYSSYAKYY